MIPRTFYGICFLLWCLSGAAQAEITVAAFNVRPWGYIDENGQVAGHYIPMMRAFGRQLKTPMAINPMPYPRMLQDISSGKADLAILMDDEVSAGIGHRLALLPVSEVVLVLRPGLSMAKLKTLSEPRLGRVTGTYYQAVSQYLPIVNYVGMPNLESGFAMLAMSRVDALVLSNAALELAVEEGVSIAATKFEVEEIGKISAALYLSKSSDKAVDLARYRAIAHQVVDEMTSVKIGPEAQQAKSLFIKKKNK